MEYAPAYMDRRALMYMREWMSNSIGDEGAVEGDNFVTMHRRMQWSGLVRAHEGEMSTMTALGMYVVDILSRRSYNFFPFAEIADIWPVQWLEQASAQAHKVRELPSRHTVTNFFALFQLEFPLDMDLRQYVRDRIRADTDSGGQDPMHRYMEGLPDQLVNWPELSVDFTRASDVAGDFDDPLEMSTGDLSQYLQSHRAEAMEADPRLAELHTVEATGILVYAPEAARGEPCGVCEGSAGRDHPRAMTLQEAADMPMELGPMAEAWVELPYAPEAARGEPCGVCEGSGDDPFDDGPCKACGGSGREPGSPSEPELTPDEAAGEMDQGSDDDEDEGFSI